MRNYLSFTKRNYFTHDTETIFIVVFLPNTKPMTVDIIHRPPSQTSFLEIVNIFKNLTRMTKKAKIQIRIYVKLTKYVLGKFHINLYLNTKKIFEKCSTALLNIVPYDVWKYQEFLNLF